MPSEVVQFETEAETGVIRLNRPQVHNAVDEAALARLESILDEADSRPDIRCLILTAAGRETFCAGGDLRYFAALDTREKGVAMSRRMQAVLARLGAGGRVVIAAINGRALGGGCEMLTACHFRIASRTATFRFVQAANGITTGWGGGVRLFELVGRAQALRLLLTAEQIDAAEALRIGLVDSVVEPDDVTRAAFGLARKICKNSSTAIRAFLELAEAIRRGDYPRAVEREAEMFGDGWVGEDFRRVIARFLAGRGPDEDGQ